ncbi:MAG: hypothetical protein H6Q73_167 [Firmicutes bacterium]|nr:hypothetical protein [Bacillota bacterium]
MGCADYLKGFAYAKTYHRSVLNKSSDEDIAFLIKDFKSQYRQRRDFQALGMAGYYWRFLTERRKHGAV